ncbi:hypothetical protein AGMMS50256_39570 [Betaproteobacteria bacterium]|nr:hypothetical protein AGMMS50256_39570 [Betaproteobacteria bacterium]
MHCTVQSFELKNETSSTLILLKSEFLYSRQEKRFYESVSKKIKKKEV